MILLGILLGFQISCRPIQRAADNEGLTGDLVIFHAGSLTIPVQHLTEAFHSRHPGVSFTTEAAGSRTTARKVSELDRQADLVMSADYQVIENLLIPEFASWNILFARNTMVLAYDDKSLYSGEINVNNWYEILLREEVEFGHSDPNSDPNGYRTLMVWQLAEEYYQEEDLYQQLDLASPPENVRPKETDLIALLETGELDYIFNYLSVAVQHDLEYVILPDPINLSQLEYAADYRRAELEISGRSPGETILISGKPIVYGVTIPKNAPKPGLAEEFLLFLLSAEGQEILRKQGQPPLRPARGLHVEALPPVLAGEIQAFNSQD